MIEWDKIKNGLDNLFGNSDKKQETEEDYLTTLYQNLEQQRLEYKTVPFKIIDLKEQGFKIKVGGLYGYISFYHMPWKYRNAEAWKNVFPFIKNKTLFAKIFELNRFENSIAIKLNGKIPQFKSVHLQYDDQYQGIIINKTNFGIFIDIGYDFNWECGSIVGMIHKSYFENIELFEELEVGQIINVYYWGSNDNNQLMIGTDKRFKEWITNDIEKMIGNIVNVAVKILDENNKEYIVENTYQGLLPINKSIYPGIKALVRTAIKNLKDKEIIKCEVISINKSKKALNLKWISNAEMENAISRTLPQTNTKTSFPLQLNNSIENMVKPEIVDKLNLVGKIVNVEVQRIDENTPNKYLVEGKYKGKLSITNDNYRISVTEKKIIEKNLQDGDIINCEILSIEKKLIRIKWKISNDELSRFINVKVENK